MITLLAHRANVSAQGAAYAASGFASARAKVVNAVHIIHSVAAEGSLFSARQVKALNETCGFSFAATAGVRISRSIHEA